MTASGCEAKQKAIVGRESRVCEESTTGCAAGGGARAAAAAAPPAGAAHAATGASSAYNTDDQLNNHTDQSLYGTPGFLLAFHCARGEGNNSITDGFAVARALHARSPEHFAALAEHGMDAGRHLDYYRGGDMSFRTASKVLQLDADGELHRVCYHDIFRAPLTVPYADFERYFAALRAFYELVHSGEFQMSFTLRAGQAIVFNNWRMMHGRAGLAGKARVILGGTVTRDAFYSTARMLLKEKYGLSAREEVGLAHGLFHKLARYKGQPPPS